MPFAALLSPYFPYEHGEKRPFGLLHQHPPGRILGRNSAQQQVDLGGGLIIHDLDQKVASNQSESSMSNERTRTGGQEDNQSEESESRATVADPADNTTGISIPWTLVACLVAITAIVFAIKLWH